MRSIRVLLCLALFFDGFVSLAVAQTQQEGAPLATLHVNSRLVFLDTTVVDKKGNIVTSGLTKDDFLITDDKKPQRIFSFEPPDQHRDDPEAAGSDAPVTIFVIDQLNDSFNDFSFIRHAMQQYLEEQPEELDSPCELMLLGYGSFQMVQGLTRRKAELLSALDQIHAVPPNPGRIERGHRLLQSIYALQLIALQSKGVPGRKNIVWVGYGGPGISRRGLIPSEIDYLNRLMHNTTNMLVDARVSLFLIYPGLPPYDGPVPPGGGLPLNSVMSDFDGPFGSDFKFSAFTSETGGSWFFNRNNVDVLIKRSQELGAGFYTLTYQPQQGPADGKFRNIRVAMRNPELRAITKTGYFAPDKEDSENPKLHLMENLMVAVRSTVPLHGFDMAIEDIFWRPDTGTAQFTLVIEQQNLRWRAQADGTSDAHLFVVVASLNGHQEVLAATSPPLTLTVSSKEITAHARIVSHVPIAFRVPPKTKDVRIVVESEDGDRLGSGVISRNVIDTAPQTATPDPVLIPRPAR